MRRALTIFVVLFAALAAPAGAHPLGNFSINHVAEVSVSADRVDVRYLLDQAEIPTFQERGVARAERVRRKQAEVLRRLHVEADGRALTLTPAGAPRLELRAGAGGLRTTRFELALTATARGARRVVVRDGTYPGRARSSPAPAAAPRCGRACPPPTPRAGSPAIPPTPSRAPPTSAPPASTPARAKGR
jgi:nickel/cobalt transporter (NicO) family protein